MKVFTYIPAVKVSKIVGGHPGAGKAQIDLEAFAGEVIADLKKQGFGEEDIIAINMMPGAQCLYFFFG